MANLVYQRLVKDTSTTAVELKEGTPLQSAALLLKCFRFSTEITGTLSYCESVSRSIILDYGSLDFGETIE